MDMQNEFDRLLFFEHARKTAEATYTKNPLDTENLTRWGGALLELSQFQNEGESRAMIQEAISKLGEALEIDPKKHDALWCIGNAHTTQAFMIQDQDEANEHFEKATIYFQQALAEDPGNELYAKSLEVAAKAPELHQEFQQSRMAQQAMAAGPGPSASSNTKSSTKKKKKRDDDFIYDVCGWVVLAVGIVAWIGFAKSQMPPPPPPPMM